ncbi:uncharacterized protein LOC130899828 [Diorhabda carinulata]|uniref:uncharacterized protein LOC130899828 n=1 Tax=Diorhabda carinulata TaxID=1163345 RepID=UPI0025A22521|nr:uncharacterized protein LOC130899828 [Diorhabda carinulata]XP_057665953.1 uncharacterized protein LOC130899828 [Diorhabda carinulata]XP_057665954.1 uncharacterized protein LOC130899828 [Diorhabda carinulata]XP_057665956.1 uncharacterized protein LOC130899828 [Diorhabda carinulata]
MEEVESTTENKHVLSIEELESDNTEAKGDMKKTAKYKKRVSNYKFIRNSGGLVTLYITSCEKDIETSLSIDKLKDAIPNLNLDSTIQTNYGLVINLLNDTYVQKILQMDLAKIFGRPVQAVPLFSGHYKKIVSFKEIPWCICLEEIENCLRKQGVNYAKLTREKSTLYVEVLDFPNYQRLKEEGINFYDSVVFQASDDAGINEEIHYNNDNIIQCYKCQGFWHTANTCKQNIRCVRCGEEHQVENCNRPKSSAICCNCKGPHHAAYKLCPVRVKLQKSVRVSFTLDQ